MLCNRNPATAISGEVPREVLADAVAGRQDMREPGRIGFVLMRPGPYPVCA
jgi:hypothetical protein